MWLTVLYGPPRTTNRKLASPCSTLLEQMGSFGAIYMYVVTSYNRNRSCCASYCRKSVSVHHLFSCIVTACHMMYIHDTDYIIYLAMALLTIASIISVSCGHGRHRTHSWHAMRRTKQDVGGSHPPAGHFRPVDTQHLYGQGFVLMGMSSHCPASLADV